MSDNYTKFSEGIAIESPEEERWLKEQLQEDPTLGPAFLRDYGTLADRDDHGFAYEFQNDQEGKRQLWIYSTDHGVPEKVVYLVQKYLKKFHPDKAWSLTWAEDCSRAEIGAFGGGAVVVGANVVHWISTHQWVLDKLNGWV